MYFVHGWRIGKRKIGGKMILLQRRILAKYKNLVFHDPDTGGSFTVWDKNMGFRHGRGYRWMLLSTCVDNDVDDEAFALDIVCELIANTAQEAGIDVVQQEE